ncbi:MAG: NifB/NifX family molybdenum-iron cluster-binding protein [Hungatella sp.]
MKIAVTYEDGQVFQHFGHCENFKIYNVDDHKIISSDVVSAIGSGHGALAGFLKDHRVETLICGGIGGGARVALAEAGIQLYPGVSGDADANVMALLQDSLDFDPNTMCSHHHEDDGHDCGSHACGEDKHGCGGNH